MFAYMHTQTQTPVASTEATPQEADDATPAPDAAASGCPEAGDPNGGSAWLEKAVDWGAPKVAAHIRLAEIALLHEEQVYVCVYVCLCLCQLPKTMSVCMLGYILMCVRIHY